MLEADVYFIRACLQFSELLFYFITLLSGKISLLQSCQTASSKVLEAGLPDVIVGWILPDWGGLDVRPCHDSVVNHRQPLVSIHQLLHVVQDCLLEGRQVNIDTIIRQ